ncbi:MAG: L-aspartate oxidase [Deltaproteobacteria bacterium]|nr:L-aspartate oxidase [Deltaproteobacteria bacterium]
MSEQSDFLVIGTGIAGLVYALKVARFGTVNVLCKREPEEGNTRYAQGGIASVATSEDNFATHIQDTLIAGAGLCREDVVRQVVEAGPERVRELIDWGVRFTHGHNGATHEMEYDLHLEGGHSTKRIYHAEDRTGVEIERALLERVRQEPNIRVFEYHMAIDLITTAKLRQFSGANRCVGVYALDEKAGKVRAFVARTTLLATGGSGKAYLLTTNPDVASGDGVAMAARAGVPVANMEFIQFHPTCLYHPMAKNFLISEAVRGAGAKLVDENGRRFMDKYDERGELAPRDVVARAIDHEIKTRGVECVYLDFSGQNAAEITEGFPGIYERCYELGIDITTDLIPVAPAAHYQCGGVVVDSKGRTSVAGLYAVGEVSCTGLHGANRLASNSLLEAAVFAHEASADAARADLPLPSPKDVPEWDAGSATDSDETVVVSHNWDEIRRCMQNYVGIVRTDRRLLRAKARIDFLQREIWEYYWNFVVTRDLLELRNIAVVADLVVTSAMRRRESRGLHYNLDCPETFDAVPAKDTCISDYQKTFAKFAKVQGL